MAVSEAIVSNFIKEKTSFLVICLLRTKLRERGVGYLFKGVTRVGHLFASCLVVMGGDILVIIVINNPFSMIFSIAVASTIPFRVSPRTIRDVPKIVCRSG